MAEMQQECRQCQSSSCIGHKSCVKTQSKTHGTDMRKWRSRQKQYQMSTDERQDVEQEFKTAQQQVKKMTTKPEPGAKGARSSTSTSLTRRCRTKQFSQHQTRRNHSLYATRKDVDKKLRASGERSTNQSTRTS